MLKNISIYELANTWTLADLIDDSVPKNTITMSFYDTETENEQGLHILVKRSQQDITQIMMSFGK